MVNMEIELIPEITFTLQINEQAATGFKVESRWECFTKYSNGKMWFICFDQGMEPFLKLLGATGSKLQIAACSPSLTEHFFPKPEPPQPEPPPQS